MTLQMTPVEKRDTHQKCLFIPLLPLSFPPSSFSLLPTDEEERSAIKQV